MRQSSERLARWQVHCFPKNTRTVHNPSHGRRPMKQNIGEVMTPNPKALAQSATIMEAACAMRDNDIGDVVVLDNGRLCGILTDRDIVVRALAAGCDPTLSLIHISEPTRL